MSGAYDGLPDELNPLKRKAAPAAPAPGAPAQAANPYEGLSAEINPQTPPEAMNPDAEIGFRSLGRTALDGALMGWGAEARGLLESTFGNSTYTEARDREQARLDAFKKANPALATAADITGGVAGTLPMLLTAPPSALARLGPMGARLAAMIGGGAIQGGIAGAGNAQEGERLAGAGTGAAVGAVAAPIIGGAISGASRVARAGADFFGGRYAGNADKRAVRELADLVGRNGGVDALEGRLAESAATQARQAVPNNINGMVGQPQAMPTPMMQETLAERLGSPMVKRVDDLSNMEGATRGGVQELLTNRADEQVRVMNGAIDSVFGNRPNAYAQRQMTQQNRHQMTERAVNDMLDQYQTGPQHIDQIRELFRTTPASFLNKAAASARIEGDDLHRVFIPDPNDPNGVQLVEQAIPTVRNLHNIFKAARRAGSATVDGKPTAEAMDARAIQENVRRVMNDIMGEDNFAAVNRAWSDPTRNLEALDLGRKAAGTERPEALRDQIGRFVQNDDDRDAFLAGVADSLRERVRTNADVGRNPSIAAKLWQPRERENIREALSVLYPDRADRDAAFRRLDDTMRSLEAAHATRGAVQGSLTAPRQAGRDQLEGRPLQSLAQGGAFTGAGMMTGGVVGGPVGAAVGAGAGMALSAVERSALAAQRLKINDAMGRRLLSTAPAEQQATLQQIIERLRAEQARNRGWDLGLIPGMAAGGAVGGIRAREDER